MKSVLILHLSRLVMWEVSRLLIELPFDCGREPAPHTRYAATDQVSDTRPRREHRPHPHRDPDRTEHKANHEMIWHSCGYMNSAGESSSGTTMY